MSRRRFLKWSALSFLGAALPLPAFLGRMLEKRITTSFASLNYLAGFKSYVEIEKLLTKYDSFEIVVAQDVHQLQKLMKNQQNYLLLSLNTSYGRWANFKVQDLHRALENNPQAIEQLFVETTGQAGKELLRSSQLQVVSKISKKIESALVIYDACPHFYNSLKVKNFRRKNVSYFIDETTRSSLFLVLSPTTNVSLAKEDLAAFRYWQEQLQKDLNTYESKALARISATVEIRSFSEILALKKESIA